MKRYIVKIELHVKTEGEKRKLELYLKNILECNLPLYKSKVALINASKITQSLGFQV